MQVRKQMNFPFVNKYLKDSISFIVPDHVSLPATKEDPPQKLADAILMAVLRDDREQMGFSFRFAHWLRVSCPPFYHLMMEERARKMFEAARAGHERY